MEETEKEAEGQVHEQEELAVEGPEQELADSEGQDKEELTERLEEAEAKAEEYLDGWQRARAELSNYRKRMERQQEDFSKYANAELIARLLPILDDMERAFRSMPPELHSLSWLEGIQMIDRKMRAALEQEGVEPIEAEGKQFDPRIHEAVMQEETGEYAEGTVIAELQTGYKLHDRVLRPTLVNVAKAPPEEEEPEMAAEEPAAEGEPR